MGVGDRIGANTEENMAKGERVAARFYSFVKQPKLDMVSR